jgi:hypothetical protein
MNNSKLRYKIVMQIGRITAPLLSLAARTRFSSPPTRPSGKGPPSRPSAAWEHSSPPDLVGEAEVAGGGGLSLVGVGGGHRPRLATFHPRRIWCGEAAGGRRGWPLLGRWRRRRPSAASSPPDFGWWMGGGDDRRGWFL